MADRSAKRRVHQALGSGGAISPYGTGKVREVESQNGESYYALIPKQIAELWGLNGSEDTVLGYHPPSNSLVVTPVDQPEDPAWASFDSLQP